MFWVNVPAGDYVIELHPPEGTALDCSASFFDDSGQSARSLGGTRYAVRARPGVLSSAGFLYCSAVPAPP
jgi:hypothetical protein